MSAQLPLDSAERAALAGEYVLGMVDARTAASVAREVPRDATLREAVEAWEDRLTPLASAVPQEAPPPELWDRIAARLPANIPLRAAAVLPQPSQARGIGWLWRAWAMGASVAAVAFAGIALVQTDRHRQLEATLQAAPPPGAAQPSQFVAQPPPPPAPGQVPVQQAITRPAADAPVILPASADAAIGQPTLGLPQAAPLQATPRQAAPSAVVDAPAQPVGPVITPVTGPDTAPIVRPSTGGDGAGVIRR